MIVVIWVPLLNLVTGGRGNHPRQGAESSKGQEVVEELGLGPQDRKYTYLAMQKNNNPAPDDMNLRRKAQISSRHHPRNSPTR